jgi:hypothetical protein
LHQLSLHAHSLPLLALRNPRPNLLLIQLLLVELCGPLRVVLPPDVLECSEIVPNCVLLASQGSPKVLAQGNERETHDTVRDNLMMVHPEKEEKDASNKRDVPLLKGND